MQPNDVSFYSQPKPKKGPTIALIIVIVLLAISAGVLGFFYKKEVDAHRATARDLEKQVAIVNQNAQVIRDAKLEPGFRNVIQEAANRDCLSKSAVLFNTTTSVEKNADGSIKKYFGVGQYFCNSGNMAVASPIRFVAAQSQDEATWEFTYGSSTAAPTALPGYIFNTDPALFNRKFNNPSKF